MPNVDQLFEEMSEVNRTINRYAYSLSADGGPSYYTEGEFDRINRSRYSKTTVGDIEAPRTVDFYWIGDNACGKPIHINHWFNVHVLSKPPNLIAAALNLVSPEDEKELVENGDKWVIEARPNLERLHDDTENLLSEIFNLEKLIDDKGNRFVASVMQTLQQVNVTIRYILARDTLELNESQLILSFDDHNVTISAKFWDFNSESIQISFPEAARHNEGEKVSFGFLFLKPDKSGWTEYNHMLITAEAIKLIKAFDNKGHYEEIYKDNSAPNYYGSVPNPDYGQPNHPSVHGAWAEDAWDDIRTSQYHLYDENVSIPSLKYRSFNHFGYGDQGLQWRDYFYLISKDVRKPLNGKFVSALHWGKEDGEQHEETEFFVEHLGEIHSYKNDPMNFKGAIKAYGYGDDQGRIEGYRRMGHVLHLLQDLAQPDHAERKDHAGSGKTHQEAVNMFNFCDAKLANDVETALAIALPSAGLGTIIMIIASCADNHDCKSGDLNRVGFERLINDKWQEVLAEAPWIEPSYVETFKRHLVDEGYNYDVVFENMGIEATRAANKRNLTLPLGLGSLTVAISAYVKLALFSDDPLEQEAAKHTTIMQTIPGLRPLINIDNPNLYKPYIELAREVLDKAILRSASMLIHFLDIVNPPPIVQSVAAVKGVSGLIPDGYARFKQNQINEGCSSTFTAYKAKWENSTKIREKIIEKDFPLSSSHSIYVFVTFGPTLWSGLNQRMKKDSVVLQAISPRDFFNPIDIQLKSITDESYGEYYWGEFVPPELGIDYDILLEIEGEDDTAHLANRRQQVRLLDSDPSTVAHVDVENVPDYPFVDYEPGADRNHLLHVKRSIVKDQLERNDNDNFNSATRVILTNESRRVNFQELTMDSVNDTDFFHISYESLDADDKTTSSGAGDLATGLNFRIEAPRLEFWLSEEFNGCLSIRIYNADKTVFRDYEIINDGSPWYSIEAPSANLTGNKELYIALKNTNYRTQGSLRYNIAIAYVPPKLSFEGKILYEFWKYLGYPFPPPPIHGTQPFNVIGNPPDSLIYHNLDLALEHLHQFAKNYHDTNEMTEKDKNIWSARVNFKVGVLAKKLHREEKAIELFRGSSKALESNGLVKEANIAKRLLRESLINTNQINEARKILI